MYLKRAARRFVGIPLFPLFPPPLSLAPITAQIRVPWNDPIAIKRVLDIGARSLLVPFVQNADEARQAVASARYPPLGALGGIACQKTK